jgi:hypothetical protein
MKPRQKIMYEIILPINSLKSIIQNPTGCFVLLLYTLSLSKLLPKDVLFVFFVEGFCQIIANYAYRFIFIF